PYEDIIEYSIQVERRYGLYDDFLSEAIEISNPSLINKVAIKFLENIRKERNVLIVRPFVYTCKH
ncbi:transcriptional regulator, partial [Brevibacillus laterosporus]